MGFIQPGKANNNLKDAKRVMRTLQLAALLAAFALALSAQNGLGLAIRPGYAIFIDKMPNDLDGYIKAELIKQKIPLNVVSSPRNANLIMTGTSTREERLMWHEGWLNRAKDKTAGNVEVLDAGTMDLVWAGEAGDRSLLLGWYARGGQRKVASRIVGRLKKAIKR